jgi:hypothetical protein
LSDTPDLRYNADRQPASEDGLFRHRFGGMPVLRRFLLIGWVLSLTVTDAGARHPLAPYETSSPRATLESYLELSDELGHRFVEYRDAPSRATQAAFKRTAIDTLRLLDLSKVPAAAREENRMEAVLLLWEVMLRLELPNLEVVPGASDVKKGGEDTEPESLSVSGPQLRRRPSGTTPFELNVPP